MLWSNANSAICLRVEGNTTVVRLGQLSKAHFPIDVTPSGIVMLVRPVRLNTPCSMLVSDVDNIVAFFKLLQWQNASLPILITLLGIVTLVRPEQPENAELPMLVTLLGIVTFVRLGQL